MEILIRRIAKKPTYTIGKLYIDGQYFCDTLEDKDRGLCQHMPLKDIEKVKVYAETAIPLGTYKIDMNTPSPKFLNTTWAKPYGGKIPRLVNVPGYAGVLIHPGNTDKHTAGCVLVGQNKVVGLVINSQATWKELMQKLIKDKNNIILTIE